MLIENTYIHSPTHKFFSFFCITSDYSKGQEMCLLDRLTPGEKMYIVLEEHEQEEIAVNRNDCFIQPIFSVVYFSLI